jgi:hypothetical protein
MHEKLITADLLQYKLRRMGRQFHNLAGLIYSEALQVEGAMSGDVKTRVISDNIRIKTLRELEHASRPGDAIKRRTT